MNMTKFGKAVVFALIAVGLLYALVPKYIRPYPDKDGFPLQQKWTQTLKGNIRAITTTDDGSLILARTYSFLYAIEPETGAIRWRYVFYYQHLAEPPIAHKGVVYFADDRAVYAVGQSNGNELWHSRLHGADNVIFVSDEIIMVNSGGTLCAYKTTTGEFLWRTSVGNGRIEAYVIDGVVFVFDYRGISILSVSTGEEMWNQKPGFVNDSALFDGFAYFSADDKVMRFDPENRTISWKIPIPFYDSREFALYGDTLLVPELEEINAINKETGDTLWRQKITPPLNPVIIGDTVYVMEMFSHEVFAFDLQTGAYKGKLHSSLPVLLGMDREDMTATNEMLFFSMRNFLYAYGQ